MRSLNKKLLFAFLCSTILLAGCGGGGSSSDDEDVVTDPNPNPNPVPVADSTPDQFSFMDQTNVTTGTEITSNTVMISGIDTPAAVTVAGGSYSVGCTASFINTASTINNGQTVCVRHTSSDTASTSVDTTLTIGGITDTFTSFTAAPAGADTTPEAFNFTDQTGVAASTMITSAPVTITGIDTPAAVTVTGGSYSVGCTASFINTGSTIMNGETVCVRHTSAAAPSTATDTTLTVGGVSDIFTSTTAAAVAPVVGLLPFLTGAGNLRLLDPTAAIALPDTNPKTVDSGLAPPPVGVNCNDCFGQAQAFFTGVVSGTTVSNLHASRLAYAKRAVGNDSGGMVYKLDITQGGTNTPVRISSLTNACRIINTETTDFLAIDNSAVVVERAGADLLCSETLDNVATVIRLNTPSTAGSNGMDIPLALEAANPLHAQTNAQGVITGYISFESNGTDPILVHRDANLVADAVPLLVLEQTTGASIERTDLTHLFVTAPPDDQGLQLYRVEAGGSLSPVLYSFAGFNAGNPIQDGLHDATNLYFSDANLMLRVPVNSVPAEFTTDAVVMTTLNNSLRISGNRALDTSKTPSRVVFDAQDDSLTIASGVFSVATTANNAPATPLANYPAGGSVTLEIVAQGRAYINRTVAGEAPEALKIYIDGVGQTVIAGSYWAGSSRATSFDLALVSAVPTQYIFLATRVFSEGVGEDTVNVVDPLTGVTGAVMGAVSGAATFEAVKIIGLGRYALARAERDRGGALDNDVYFLDAATAGSLVPLAETGDGNDIPLITAGN